MKRAFREPETRRKEYMGIRNVASQPNQRMRVSETGGGGVDPRESSLGVRAPLRVAARQGFDTTVAHLLYPS